MSCAAGKGVEALRRAPVVGMEQALWLRQFGAVLTVDLRRILWTRRALPLLLLAGVPVAATVLAALFGPHTGVFHYVFTTLVVGVGVFFGAAVTQTKLLRGEIVAQTLHYHLLSPISRDALLLGKYLAGLVATGGVFMAVTLACHAVRATLGVDLPPATGDWPSPSPLSAQLAVVALGCAAYGALFLLFGALFRNPVFPVAGLLGWELLHYALPPALQTLSVAHYLQGLLGDEAAPPGWVCVLALLVIAAGAVALACRRLRRIDVG